MTGPYAAARHVDQGAKLPESQHVRVLRRLAESTGGRFWVASAPETLANAFVEIAEAMKTRYVLRFDPQGVAREGRHALAVRLVNRSGAVHHRKAYFVGGLRAR